MTRERYIELRNKSNSFFNNFSLPLFYEYYLHKGGFIKDFNNFAKYFNQYMVIFDISVNSIFDFMDREFEVTVVYDKNGKFIKVI